MPFSHKANLYSSPGCNDKTSGGNSNNNTASREEVFS